MPRPFLNVQGAISGGFSAVTPAFDHGSSTTLLNQDLPGQSVHEIDPLDPTPAPELLSTAGSNDVTQGFPGWMQPRLSPRYSTGLDDHGLGGFLTSDTDALLPTTYLLNSHTLDPLHSAALDEFYFHFGKSCLLFVQVADIRGRPQSSLERCSGKIGERSFVYVGNVQTIAANRLAISDWDSLHVR